MSTDSSFLNERLGFFGVNVVTQSIMSESSDVGGVIEVDSVALGTVYSNSTSLSFLSRASVLSP